MFTHLHLHTEYSLLDGLGRVPDLMDRAVELGQEAIGLTDHGVLYAAIDFYREAKARGIKPIIGIEAYIAPGSRFSRDPADKSSYHLTLLSRNLKGYRNLLALVTRANLEGYYYKPRMDREILEEHAEGLIALSGCNSSQMHRLLMDGRYDEAVRLARWCQERFDAFYLELQEHGNLREVTEVNKLLVRLSRETGIPLVATNDVHYVRREDAPLQDVLLCIGTNASVNDERRMRMSDDSYYLKSEDEMRAAFPELPEAVTNTWRVAEQCDLEMEFGRQHLPEPDLPPNLSPHEYLEKLAREGLARRYPGSPGHAVQRLEYELDVIRETGFSNYIHVVREVAEFAHRHGIPMGVRGSAAASVVLYCLGVTDVDPLAHRLVFERFLNRERREMPDVDFDFADDRRDEVIRWAADRYGHDRVAQIITFGTMGAKAVIRDVGRALGMSYGEVDRVARLVPAALNMTIDRALEENAEFRQAYELDERVRTLVNTAKGLEGIARHASTHAAGVVISSDPLVEHVPLQRPPRGDEGAIPTTQYAMEQVAAIGLLKMDFLGLANLTILGRAVQFIRESRGEEIDLQHLPDGDPATFDMLSRGETFGVFQLESAGMRRHIQELRPANIADLAAMVALYRPGPMQHITAYCKAKHGEEPITYPHPDLADILDETYGIITYQDQVLLIAQKFAGYTLGQADVMRKAMGKKIPEVMRAERERFVEGALAKGYAEADAAAVFDLILPFAGYAFNKPHAVCYATIAYQTAYLKAHYPAEYMTAVLSQAGSHPGGAHERIAAAVAECARLDIPVLPPDVNRSDVNFALERGDGGGVAIRFGLAMIKNVGQGAAEALVEARRAGGPFASVDDFCRRVALKSLNKRALESLVKAGALDCLGERGTLLANLDRLLSLAQREQRLRETGQATMFDLFGDSVATPMPALELQPAEVPRSEMLAWEKELLGVYVSEHPFSAAAAVLAKHVTAVCAEIGPEFAAAAGGGRDVVLAGMVTGIRTLSTRDGRTFIAVEIEDLSGSLEVTVWPDLYEQTRELWIEGNILILLVRVRERNDRVQAGVQQVALFQARGSEPEPFRPPAWLLEELATAGVRPEQRGRSGGASPDGSGGSNPGPAARRNGDRGVEAADPPSPSDPSASPTAGVGLRLRIDETDDEESDRRRLAGLLQILAQYAGSAEVRLVVRTRDGHQAEFALPPVRPCPELVDAITDVLGAWGAVETAGAAAPA